MAKKTKLQIIELQIEQRKTNIIELRKRLQFEITTLKRFEAQKLRLMKVKKPDISVAQNDPVTWVSTNDLSVYLKKWLTETGRTVVDLASIVEIDKSTLYAIRDCRTKHTNELLADKLLSAINLSHVLGNEVPVITFPIQPPSQYQED